MRNAWIIGALLAALTVARPAYTQQFNSDSYLSKAHGVATVIVTYGQRNSMIMNTFSLLPRWEFTAAAYIYDDDRDANTDDGYSTSLFAKYMFYENPAKTGGFAMKVGTGLDPGYLDAENRLQDAFRTYWVNAPATIPLLNNELSWDLMPGASVTNHGKGIFTYTTRLAWYPESPTWSLVGEIVGAKGEGTSPPEYRAGFRFEPNPYAVFAITYDQEFSSLSGAGVEFGMMLFTPPFFGIGMPKK